MTCYPQDHKQKSLAICSAFAEGCGGVVDTSGEYRGGDSMFYGIDSHNEACWNAAFQNMTSRYLYADNAFLDPTRGRYFRVGKNRLQHHGRGRSDCSRFKSFDIPIKPWRRSGSFILICPQSDHFMRVAAHYPGNWLEDVLAKLRDLTDRELRVRPWNRDKVQAYQELPAAMEDCWALVTYSSASAITAILAGVPAIATGECIVSPMCGGLETIEAPLRPDNRLEWAGVLSDQQWTLPEMSSGLAWRMLNAAD